MINAPLPSNGRYSKCCQVTKYICFVDFFGIYFLQSKFVNSTFYLQRSNFFLQISTFYFVTLLATMSLPKQKRARNRLRVSSGRFTSNESDDDEDAFFRSRLRPHVNVQDVVANYLHDASDTLASLDVWPSLKPMFIKLTTKFKFFSLLSAPATVIL